MSNLREWTDSDLKKYRANNFEELLRASRRGEDAANVFLLYGLLDACHSPSSEKSGRPPLEVLFHPTYHSEIFRFPQIFEEVVFRYARNKRQCACELHSAQRASSSISPKTLEDCQALGAAIWWLFLPFIQLTPLKPVLGNEEKLGELKKVQRLIESFLADFAAFKVVLDKLYDTKCDRIHAIFSVLLELSIQTQSIYDETANPNNVRLLKTKTLNAHEKHLAGAAVDALESLCSKPRSKLDEGDKRKLSSVVQAWCKPQQLVGQRILYLGMIFDKEL